MAGEDDVRSPRELHPVFFGSFDWHSSVHGHWMLVRLLKLYPEATVAQEIRETLRKQLTAEKLQAEADYFGAKHNSSFERMYGWAWTLRLAAELHRGRVTPMGRSGRRISPRSSKRSSSSPRPTCQNSIGRSAAASTRRAPSRSAQMLDYARICGNSELGKLVREKAIGILRQGSGLPGSLRAVGQRFFFRRAQRGRPDAPHLGGGGVLGLARRVLP